MPDDHIKQIQILWHPDWEEDWLQSVVRLNVQVKSYKKKIKIRKVQSS